MKQEEHDGNSFEVQHLYENSVLTGGYWYWPSDFGKAVIVPYPYCRKTLNAAIGAVAAKGQFVRAAAIEEP